MTGPNSRSGHRMDSWTNRCLVGREPKRATVPALHFRTPEPVQVPLIQSTLVRQGVSRGACDRGEVLVAQATHPYAVVAEVRGVDLWSHLKGVANGYVTMRAVLWRPH